MTQRFQLSGVFLFLTRHAVPVILGLFRTRTSSLVTYRPANFSQPQSGPCKLNTEYRQTNRYHNECGPRQYDERDAYREHRATDNGHRNSPSHFVSADYCLTYHVPSLHRERICFLTAMSYSSLHA